MCNKLLQNYACGHSKSICTTPCAHALKSASPTTPLASSTHVVTRSNSTVSALSPSQSQKQSQRSMTNFSHHLGTSQRTSTVVSSPLHYDGTAGTAAQRDLASVPAFHFVAPSTPSPTLSNSPVSPSFPSPAQYSHDSVPSTRFPSPSLPSPQSLTSAPSVETQEVQPALCEYYIPRYLMTSKYPCIECYGKPEWEALRMRWMEAFRLGHPLDRVEGVEVLSGMKGASEEWRSV